MLAFAGMIAKAAEDAGIKVPNEPDGDFDKDEFPHFAVFCNVQLCRAMTDPAEHWGNAHIIAKIPNDQIRNVTISHLRDLGFRGI